MIFHYCSLSDQYAKGKSNKAFSVGVPEDLNIATLSSTTEEPLASEEIYGESYLGSLEDIVHEEEETKDSIEDDVETINKDKYK